MLDNCEHLVEACERLADALLHACPGLRILATSREALGVAGETVLLVPPLSLPEPGHPAAPKELERYEAVKLFFERAASASPTFGLDERNAPAVAMLCRNLDGIPLAIELAAARTKVLSVAQIYSRLAENFRLLKSPSRTADPRQQTLAATLEWSHDLLDETERALFRRLSVFAGGFTLGAAERVCAGGGIEEDDVLDQLTRLIDKSLATLGIVALTQEDYAAARASLEESVEICRDSGDDWALSLALRNLGIMALKQGDYERAATRLAQSELALEEPRSAFGMLNLDIMAAALSMRGDHERATRLFGAAAAAREAAGVSVLPFISPNTVNRHLNSIYHKLGVSSRAAATRFATEHRLA